jgi:L-lactate dehydrogenase complex protein LldG
VEREKFLGRVSAALRGAELPTIEGPLAAPAITFAEPVERFVDQATAVAANIVRVPDAAAAFGVVADLFGESQEYIAWDDLDVFAPGWRGWVAASALHRVDATVVDRIADQGRIGAVKIGITGADVGVAATGSVVLCHGPGRPRSASLLVEDHIVLLPIDRIVPSLTEALDQVGWQDNSNIAVITGPSRTGDIESILTLGVHGPHRLHIVLVG